MVHILELPDALLLKIFAHIGVPELCRSVRQTCSHWDKLSYDMTLWRYLDINELKNVVTWRTFLDVVQFISDYIEHIDLSFCEQLLASDDTVLWDVNNGITFSNLRSINFLQSGVEDGFIQMLCILKDKFPLISVLQNLTCDSSDMIKTMSVRNMWTGLSVLTGLLLSAESAELIHRIDMATHILKFVEQNPSIASLELCHSTLEDEIFIDVINSTSKLKKLNIAFSPSISLGFLECSSKLSQLTKLDISDTHINDYIFGVICTSSPHLQSVNICGCGRISDVGITSLTQHCPKLKSLCLNTRFHVPQHFTDGAFIDIGNNCKHLEELYACYCVGLSINGIKALIEGCIKLKTLDLSSNLSVTSEAVLCIANYSSQLEELILQGCTHLTSQSINQLVCSCLKLSKLFLQTCHYMKHLNFDAFTNHNGVRSQICNNNGLQNNVMGVSHTLNMEHNTVHYSELVNGAQGSDETRQLETTSNQQQQISYSVENLETASELQCQYEVTFIENTANDFTQFSNDISSQSLIHTSLLRGPCRLRIIDLSFCSKIANDSVKQIAKHCPLLRYLSIIGCYHVTNEAIETLVKQCRLLQVLNIGGYSIIHAPKFDDGALLAISKHCQNLVALHCSGNKGLTMNGYSAVIEECKTLETLKITLVPGKTSIPDLVAEVSKFRSHCSVNGIMGNADLSNEEFMKEASNRTKGDIILRICSHKSGIL